MQFCHVFCFFQVSVPSDLGGRTNDEFLQRKMGFVKKNDLAKQFSVYGRNDKRALDAAEPNDPSGVAL